jgi:tRNA-Thr(GGU) m(6)t(6)A37 methyltransferase TsaA
MDQYSVTALGHVRGGRSDITDDRWASVSARIELDPRILQASATLGLSEFSHIEVVYLFHRVSSEDLCTGARHPRGRPDWPEVGILAQRAKDRPNRIGITTCQLINVNGLTLEVKGLDAVDGTPVVDIKPYMTGFAPRDSIREPPWAVELMSYYW